MKKKNQLVINTAVVGLIVVLATIYFGALPICSEFVELGFNRRINTQPSGEIDGLKNAAFISHKGWICIYALFTYFGILIFKKFSKMAKHEIGRKTIKWILISIMLLIMGPIGYLIFIEHLIFGELLLYSLLSLMFCTMLPSHTIIFFTRKMKRGEEMDYALLACMHVLFYSIIVPFLLGDMTGIIQILFNSGSAV